MGCENRSFKTVPLVLNPEDKKLFGMLQNTQLTVKLLHMAIMFWTLWQLSPWSQLGGWNFFKGVFILRSWISHFPTPP